MSTIYVVEASEVHELIRKVWTLVAVRSESVAIKTVEALAQSSNLTGIVYRYYAVELDERT